MDIQDVVKGAVKISNKDITVEDFFRAVCIMQPSLYFHEELALWLTQHVSHEFKVKFLYDLGAALKTKMSDIGLEFDNEPSSKSTSTANDVEATTINVTEPEVMFMILPKRGNHAPN